MQSKINPGWRRWRDVAPGGNSHQRRVRRRAWERGQARANPPWRKPLEMDRLVFTRALTPDERAIVRGYIAERYGVVE